jgi:hypothetical protein
MRNYSVCNIYKYFVLFFVLVGITITSVSALSEPIIDLNPDIPTPKSTVMFTATIPDSGKITNVRLLVKECKSDDLCFSDSFNESMTEKDIDTFEVEITLRHDTATYIQYHVEYIENELWVKSDSVKLDLKIESNNGNSNGGNNNGTPGFEFVYILAIISIILLIFRRKRFR